MTNRTRVETCSNDLCYKEMWFLLYCEKVKREVADIRSEKNHPEKGVEVIALSMSGMHRGAGLNSNSNAKNCNSREELKPWNDRVFSNTEDDRRETKQQSYCIQIIMCESVPTI
ncbi:hypothetical protein NDU88_005458 [Pleurodeles waltl]|uniref:Uncharacterized protein n=1 Tax=Pleurodeles waltl TaxID=8319 RepID=A0AAV7PIL8_PLEWA|nr:hypothetical protein NDU88_005458 [Pleurodeles waltl]